LMAELGFQNTAHGSQLSGRHGSSARLESGYGRNHCHRSMLQLKRARVSARGTAGLCGLLLSVALAPLLLLRLDSSRLRRMFLQERSARFLGTRFVDAEVRGDLVLQP